MSNICALLSFLLLMNEMRRWKAKKEMKAKCRRCRGLYSWHHCTISKLIIQYSESWEIEKKKKKGYSLGPEKKKWRLFHIYLNSLNFNFLKKSIIYKRGLHHTLLPVQVRCKILDAWGLVHWDDPDGWYGEGGGFRMGNTCIPVVDSFWYLAKLIQYCKV